jgi:phospholipid-translocating ATPase
MLRQKKLPPSKDGRHIPLRLDTGKPLHDERRGHSYIDNTIRTSRYTIYDFVPKQLLFQFSRVGNFYFLCVGVPQTIPGLSTTGNYTTILPLMFFVLLTMAKEGFDDYRRHRLDMVENATKAMVLKSATTSTGANQHDAEATKLARKIRVPFRKKPPPEKVREIDEEFDGFRWRPTNWSDIRVGDIIKLERDDPVPADIILLHTDGEDSIAFIETMALDGETSLKSKQVSPAIEGCGTIEGIRSCPAQFILEDPNPDLYSFDGKVTVGDKTLPLTLNEIVYRGSILRNTGCATGLVINTGEECKIRKSLRRTSRSYSAIHLTPDRTQR